VLLLRRRAAKYVRILHVWKHRSMFAAFRCMANFAQESLVLCRKQRWVVRRKTHRTLVQGFNSLFVEVHQRRVVRRFVLRWQRAVLTRAWNQWLGRFCQRQQKRLKMSGASRTVIRRFSRATLGHIFRSWSCISAESQARQNADRMVSKVTFEKGAACKRTAN
jgi:hypothetical protein